MIQILSRKTHIAVKKDDIAEISHVMSPTFVLKVRGRIHIDTRFVGRSHVRLQMPIFAASPLELDRDQGRTFKPWSHHRTFADLFGTRVYMSGSRCGQRNVESHQTTARPTLSLPYPLEKVRLLGSI